MSFFLTLIFVHIPRFIREVMFDKRSNWVNQEVTERLNLDDTIKSEREKWIV